MINLKFTVIDEQHSNIQDDEIAINNRTELNDLDAWFKCKYGDDVSTVVVATASFVDNFGDADNVILHSSITVFANTLKQRFDMFILDKFGIRYLER